MRDIVAKNKTVVISFDTVEEAENFATWMSGVLRTLERRKKKSGRE